MKINKYIKVTKTQMTVVKLTISSLKTCSHACDFFIICTQIETKTQYLTEKISKRELYLLLNHLKEFQ